MIATFRHGREEDEVMGISFKKELVVDRVQVHPAGKEGEKSKLQVVFQTKVLPTSVLTRASEHSKMGISQS